MPICIKQVGGILLVLAGFSACTKKNSGGYGDDTTTVVKEWTISLSSRNENPAPPARNETGTAKLQLFSDNSLKYVITVVALAAGDALNAAHIHVGDVISNGGVVLGLNPTFSGASASGTVSGLRASFVDSLKNDVNELYFNVHSTQVGSGLLRGQLNTKLEMTADVALNGANEVPSVTTTATGIALLRLTSAKKLYAKVTVVGLESNDGLTASHIHRGAAGSNGAILIGLYGSGLYGSGPEFGTTKIISVDDSQFSALKSDAIYVNVHSSAKPSGVIRGQVR